MARTRARLLELAVKYVRDGRDGTRADRFATASSLTGIRRVEIEDAINGH